MIGKNYKADVKAKEKVEQTDKGLRKSDRDKLENVSILASGTDYALQKATNKEPVVEIAYELNKRILSLSGQPDINAEKEMWTMVDQLSSDLASEKTRGRKLLLELDDRIQRLQTENKKLSAEKETHLSNYMKLSGETAGKADAYKAEISEYQGWFGLKAVIKGLSQFIKSSLVIITVFLVLFLVLRAFAASNPIVGAIFSIFEQIAAGFIKLIQGMAPKSANFANLIPKTTFDGYKQTLDKLVDTIELLKDNQKRSQKQYTLDEILNELSKTLNDSDKGRIEEVKKTSGWH
jgi:hypothetical protein